jgi:hypothetical protein
MLVPALAGGVDAMGRWARLSLWKYDKGKSAELHLGLKIRLEQEC